jgi:hypothetical protein
MLSEQHRRHIDERMAPDFPLVLARVTLESDIDLTAAQLLGNFG